MTPAVVAGVALLIVDVALWIMIVRAGAVFIPWGHDFEAYRDGAARFLAGQSFFEPYQLAGPYGTAQVREALLYPPPILPLLAAFTVLPSVLWYAIPLAIVGWTIWRCESRGRQLIAIGLCLWPQSIGMVGVGNPGMWIVAALCLATRWPAFAPWVLVKPSLFPFALYRIHRRGWWIGLGVMALVSLAFLPVWVEWLTALRNVQSDPLYSLSNVAPMLIPIVSGGPPKLNRPDGSVVGRARAVLGRHDQRELVGS